MSVNASAPRKRENLLPVPLRSMPDDELEKIMKAQSVDLADEEDEFFGDQAEPDEGDGSVATDVRGIDPHVHHPDTEQLPAWEQSPADLDVLKRGLQAIPDDISMEQLWSTNNLLTIIYTLQKRLEQKDQQIRDFVGKTQVLGITAKRARLFFYIDIWKRDNPDFYRQLATQVSNLDKRFTA